jgi:hypothetical protein
MAEAYRRQLQGLLLIAAAILIYIVVRYFAHVDWLAR